MLRTVGKQLSRWQLELGDVAPPVVSLNLSARQFALPSLADAVSQTLDEFDLPPASLQFEVAESALTENATVSTQQIALLRELGVRVTADHFGVGASSFLTLYRLPIDSLKMDSSILSDVCSSKEVASLIHGLAVTMHNIGVALVATGVQDINQLIALQGLGCDLAQGRYFASALPAERVPIFLREQSICRYEVRGAALFGQRWAERLPEVIEA
jgi:EAL domain-containing protein (putative c-di-GMP-specific phosphodiesterase class I)